MPLDSDVFQVPPGYNAPQQVHITQGDHEGSAVIVSWITPSKPGSNQVFDTKYYYVVGGGKTSRKFWFKTPPKAGLDVAYTFGLTGHLGQTYDSNTTLAHYQNNPYNGKTVLYVGDLSYADKYPLGIHGEGLLREILLINHGYGQQGITMLTLPQKLASQYLLSLTLIDIMCLIKHQEVLLPFGIYTPQYMWLKQELPNVNRSETPWLIVIMHASFYNSYNVHYMEGETMRVVYEPWFVKYKVDVVFAGHVHAYERSERVSNIAYNITNGDCTPVRDESAPAYIIIGDGGNQEGFATNMTEPQPDYSAYREASYGHDIFDIQNRTHAYFSWHRNQDGYAVEADQKWFFNRYWNQVDDY
ncbi:hypothetical protein Pint_34769 [Pistacia integerrima]|uniref:Uncharacterized protein n=1 Tax=Pistacia integerrima TaxID=434235 RepID=A0ACC0X6F9_9ROSI|nr:hypothetical protein Pint_34769 [Pistacia integerrima]